MQVIGEEVNIRTRRRQSIPGRCLAILLFVLLPLCLPTTTVMAATGAPIPREEQNSPSTEPKTEAAPLAPLFSQPLIFDTARAESNDVVTDTVAIDSTGIPTNTATSSDAAGNPFAAWNERPAVTREEAYPTRIRIPSIGIDTFVEELGVRSNGSMATPTDPDQVGWYRAGAIPGENGNVVMAGHLDKIDGSPAVFWELAALQDGDAIYLYDRAGREYQYVVTMQKSYAYNKAPLAEIFGFDLISRLNLITCRGTWDNQKRTYTQRLVIYSELVNIREHP